jgi:hypothetical protein
VDNELINSISNKIYRQFPDVKGVKPKVQTQRFEGGKSSNTYTLSFNTKVKTSNNKSMPYTVRVVVDERGKILKTTTSR